MMFEAFENAHVEHSGYESLGDVHTINLGVVAYARLPRKVETGGAEWCLVVSRVAGSRLSMSHKIRTLKAAASVVGGSIGERVEAADADTLKRWADQYVHKSRESSFKRYKGTAETHRALESEVGYTLDNSSGGVPAELFAVVE